MTEWELSGWRITGWEIIGRQLTYKLGNDRVDSAVSELTGVGFKGNRSKALDTKPPGKKATQTKAPQQ